MTKWNLISCSLLCAAVIGCKGKHPNSAPQTFHNSAGMVMVKLPFGYYVSKYETRQSEFEAIMGHNPSTHQNPDYPVHTVTGKEAIEFCRRLTAREEDRGTLPKGFIYSLPTYKQWRQSVADAPIKGSVTPRGQNGANPKTPMPVGSGEQNRFGIYDLRGNVAEYSIDLYPASGSQLLLGASWLEHRTGYYSVRNKPGFRSPDDKSVHVGFRCVLVSAETNRTADPIERAREFAHSVTDPVPEIADIEDERLHQLAKICFYLQHLAGDKPFRLDKSRAAEAVGCKGDHASQRLRVQIAVLVRRKVLRIDHPRT
ncbi:MAG: SUMF1/EgtB/PvdO family nonheme iron enzyme, partial [Phycisphaerae bacterium]|nr:SUMF1/EgtB/PvdO family nonheme iron enzyme [Phycisphaerae bacterium]